MGVLVEELLLLARLDQGRPLDREEVDLRRIVTDSVADGRLHEPDRPLAVEIPDAEVWVHGDEARLRQVVANLLSNVRVHTPSDAAATVALSVTDDRVVLSVADTGPGLDPEAAAQVFDRFYRAETSRSRSNGGSGLGLAIAAAVAEAHGGDLTIATHPGEGATFTLSIPRTPPPAEPGDPRVAHPTGTGVST
jgi:two-component system OmpR family sensor kinase